MRIKIFSEKAGLVLAISGCIIIGLATTGFLVFRSWDFSMTMDEAKVGQFGDFIGGIVGSIFSLASVILFYVALTEQRKDIGINQNALNLQIEALNQQVEEFKAQKQEMEDTRRVYEEQTILIREQAESQKQQVKEFKLQSSIYNLQQFDSSFYSILNVLSEQRIRLNSLSNKNDFFSDLYDAINVIDQTGKNIVESTEVLHEKFVEICFHNEAILAQYFRTFNRILKLIDESSIEDIDKLNYIHTLFSQLSNNELLINYYNYLFVADDRIKSLAIKYAYFSHVPFINRIECRLPSNISSSYKTKSELSKFCNNLSFLLASNLANAKDLETDTINISEGKIFLGYPSVVALYIDGRFEVAIEFAKDIWDAEIYQYEELLTRQISLIICDSFYFSKYGKIGSVFFKEEKVTGIDYYRLVFKIDDLDKI